VLFSRAWILITSGGPLYGLSCLVCLLVFCSLFFGLAVSIRVSMSVHAMRVQDQQGPADAGSVGCVSGVMCREVGQLHWSVTARDG
jgi:hypothetical protein